MDDDPELSDAPFPEPPETPNPRPEPVPGWDTTGWPGGARSAGWGGSTGQSGWEAPFASAEQPPRSPWDHPYQPWTAPPGFAGGFSGFEVTSYPPPPPPPRQRSSLLLAAVAAGVTVALASGAIGAGIGFALRQSPTSPRSTIPSGAPGASSPSGGTSGGKLNVAQIEAAVDPGLVDVVNALQGQTDTAEGTGIILDRSGDILTNNHVIEGEGSLTVQIDAHGPTYSATVLGYDASDDVAVIRMVNPPSGLTAAPIGDSSMVNVGDNVVTIGNAYGRGVLQPASGAVTGLDESITASDGDLSENLTGMIQTNANIVPGDSGGPMVNGAGKVVGMDTAGSQNTRAGGQSGATAGYAIPLDAARQVAEEILSGRASGSIVIGKSGPLIGVVVGDAPSGNGASVQSVEPQSPAASAGIQAGDSIDSLNGTQVGSAADLTTALLDLRPGQTISIGWLDGNGSQHTASITLASGPPK